MQNREPEREAARRRSVSELLRRFFAELTAQLSASTVEIWAKVERATHRASETPDASSPPHMVQPMQQQPVQQQQTKSEPEEK